MLPTASSPSTRRDLMGRESDEKLVRTMLDSGRCINSRDVIADHPTMDPVHAKRALHRVWLKGGYERHYSQGLYYYIRKGPYADSRLGK